MLGAITMFKRILWIVFFLSVFSSTLQAQNECPGIVQTALQNLEQICSAVARNQACYANNSIASQGRTPDYAFNSVGQVVNVADIQTLVTSPLDTNNNLWGVSLMRLQANLPNNLSGQNVSLIVFGDTELTNEYQAVPTSSASVSERANLRATPEEVDNILIALDAGTIVTANGISVDSLWIRIRTETGFSGWMNRNLLVGDFSTLQPVTSATSEPMQAFILSTGVGGTICDNVPQDGLVIQTPNGAGNMYFRINNVDIRLGSGMYITFDDYGDIQQMNMYLLNGSAEVTAQGETHEMLPGQISRVFITDDGQVESTPSQPRAYDFDDVEDLAIFADALGDDFSIATEVLMPSTSDEENTSIESDNLDDSATDTSNNTNNQTTPDNQDDTNQTNNTDDDADDDDGDGDDD
jgi:hypothetical protein